MPKPEATRLDALEALIAEKRKHEGYLEKLEGRRASTPEAVYARLRDEYLTKLTDLQVKAAAEAETLAEGLREDEDALAEIEERLAVVTEERIEGELRAEVGEYDPREWSKKLEMLNATINKIEREREARSSVIERTRDLLGEATGTPVETPAPRAPRAMTTPPSAAPAPAAPSTAPGAKRGTPAPSTAAPSVDRAPTPRVSGAVKPPEAPAAKEPAKDEPRPSAPTPAKGAPIAGGPSFDELAFLNSVVGRTSTPVKVDPPAPMPRASKPVAEIKEGPSAPPPKSTEAEKPSAEPSSGPSKGAARATKTQSADDDEPQSALGRPTPRTSQAVKTLKCQECGTLNYPTEWYCERCGGELAAL